MFGVAAKKPSVSRGLVRSRLTELQSVALDLVSRGFVTKEIAAHMGITEGGAKKHLDALRRHYGAPNRAQLVHMAIEAGDLQIAGASRTAAPDSDGTSDHTLSAQVPTTFAGGRLKA